MYYGSENMDEKTFLKLCKEFIVAQRKLEKNDGFTETDDLSVLYRFICEEGWYRLRDLKERKLI